MMCICDSLTTPRHLDRVPHDGIFTQLIHKRAKKRLPIVQQHVLGANSRYDG